MLKHLLTDASVAYSFHVHGLHLLQMELLSRVYVKMDVSELRTQELIRGARHACPYLCEVRHQHQGLHSFSSLTEHLALVHEGTRLFHGGTDPKELAHFSEGTAEA